MSALRPLLATLVLAARAPEEFMIYAIGLHSRSRDQGARKSYIAQ